MIGVRFHQAELVRIREKVEISSSGTCENLREGGEVASKIATSGDR